MGAAHPHRLNQARTRACGGRAAGTSAGPSRIRSGSSRGAAFDTNAAWCAGGPGFANRLQAATSPNRRAGGCRREGFEVLLGGRPAATGGRPLEGRPDRGRPLVCRVVRLGEKRRRPGVGVPRGRAGGVPGAGQRKGCGRRGPVGDGRDEPAARSGLTGPSGLLRLVLSRQHRHEPGPAPGACIRDRSGPRSGRRSRCHAGACSRPCRRRDSLAAV